MAMHKNIPDAVCVHTARIYILIKEFAGSTSRETTFYRFHLKYSDRQAWANSMDPDRNTASDQGIHCTTHAAVLHIKR